MDLTLWAAFTVAYLVMALTPGPVVLMIASYALSQGRRSAFAVVAGTTLGDATCMLAAMLGVGALLAASATAFFVLKLVGAAYLVFLGIKLWRAPIVPEDADAPPPTGMGRMFLHAYLTTVLNPKTVLFFMVFLPQFIDPHAPFARQAAVLAATILVVGGTIDGSYSLAAASLRRFTRRPKTQRAVNRAAGGVLVGEGVLAATWRGIVA